MSDSPVSNVPNADAAAQGTPDAAGETNAQYQQRTAMTVGELRKQHGEHFAPGYQDTDKVGAVLANAGVNTVEELIQQSTKR